MGPIWLMGATLTKDCVLKTKIFCKIYLKYIYKLTLIFKIILMIQMDVALYYNVKV